MIGEALGKLSMKTIIDVARPMAVVFCNLRAEDEEILVAGGRAYSLSRCSSGIPRMSRFAYCESRKNKMVVEVNSTIKLIVKSTLEATLILSRS